MRSDELDFKQMCARHGVTPRTLRYYEYLELLSPRREGPSRWYGPREQKRMRLILHGRDFGFTLEEIRRWLALHDSHGTRAQLQVWMDSSKGKLAELHAQQRRLARAIRQLQRLRHLSARALREIGAEPPSAGPPHHHAPVSAPNPGLDAAGADEM